MYFKLSEHVWWGSMDSPAELHGQYRALLDLASNYTADDIHYRISSVPQDVVVIRLPVEELQPATPELLEQLFWFVGTVNQLRLHPLLVHCGAGWHRSPIVAVYAEWQRGERTRLRMHELRARMLELRPDVATHLPFHDSFWAWMQGFVR